MCFFVRCVGNSLSTFVTQVACSLYWYAAAIFGLVDTGYFTSTVTRLSRVGVPRTAGDSNASMKAEE
jgi:hypothetical protein